MVNACFSEPPQLCLRRIGGSVRFPSTQFAREIGFPPLLLKVLSWNHLSPSLRASGQLHFSVESLMASVFELEAPVDTLDLREVRALLGFRGKPEGGLALLESSETVVSTHSLEVTRTQTNPL